MEGKLASIKNITRKPIVLRMLNMLFKAFAIVFLLVTVAYIGFAWYVYTHKKEVLAQVTQLLNDDINGSLTIGNMETTLLEDFPRVSVRLQNIIIRDSLYSTHKKTLLSANEVSLTVNSLALVNGTILIKKLTLKNAALHLYTDETGYSNVKYISRKSKSSGAGEGSFPQLKKVQLEGVSVTIQNMEKNKLHKFKVIDGEAKIDETSSGWEADIEVNAFADGLSFNIDKGSFIKAQPVKGNIEVVYNNTNKVLNIVRNRLRIGNENFFVSGVFHTGRPKGDFSLLIENKKIKWQKAHSLLADNISEKLRMFDIKKPIDVVCEIKGFLNVPGDPLITVNAIVKENEVTTPGGNITACSFNGLFTNEYIKGKGYDDDNSAIQLTGFTGNYAGIPFVINEGLIYGLKQPVATGHFKSDFDIRKLKSFIDDDLLMFKSGTANVNLTFKADIQNFELSKPQVQGAININNASINYVPRNLDFNKIDVALNFTKEDLNISRIDLSRGKSNIEMEGNIKNFLNLYYADPGKVVLNWNIYSSKLYLDDFMGFAGSRKRNAPVATAERKGNFTEELNTLFEKSRVGMKVRVSKLYHNKFYATDARADVLLTDEAMIISNASLKHADGYIRADGQILQTKGSVSPYALNVAVVDVNVSKFLQAFGNFGMEALKADNLKGSLSSKAGINGKINDSGVLVPASMKGKVAFTMQGGMLVNFEPIRSIGKIAFPNRDINKVTFKSLSGRFDVNGDKITIHPMQVNSSLLNMDIEGVYAFGPGTEIFVAVPIRNPKRDEGITDKKELQKRRNRGIVLRLVAEDDKDGKVKIKLGRKK